MSGRDLHSRIARRARRAGVAVPPDQLDLLARYLEVLGRWNARINLTSLRVDQPNDEAIDRLLVEPLVAAAHVGDHLTLALDVGSGGGSPALPLKIARPRLRYVLVESKTRKSAFLRQVVRELELDDVEVENRRFEELLSRADLHESVDLLTIRAVRLDRKLATTMLAFMRPAGRVFLFGTGEPASLSTTPFAIVSTAPLVPAQSSRLSILERREPS